MEFTINTPAKSAISNQTREINLSGEEIQNVSVSPTFGDRKNADNFIPAMRGIFESLQLYINRRLRLNKSKKEKAGAFYSRAFCIEDDETENWDNGRMLEDKDG